MSSLNDSVCAEVSALAAGMQSWYSSGLDSAELERNVLGRMAPAFRIVSARGDESTCEQLRASFGAAGG